VGGRGRRWDAYQGDNGTVSDDRGNFGFRQKD